MGLGLLGRGVGDIAFLARYAKHLIATDLKTEKELLPSLKKLRNSNRSKAGQPGAGNITYHLGGHRFEDFNNVDLVIKAAGVPLDSPYIAEARRNNIPVEMSTSLFARLSPATLIGITGTRGKSTVTHLIYAILKEALQLASARSGHLKTKVFLGGNVKGIATLPLLLKTKKDDIVVLELDSWQLQGFGDTKISPHVAVFTTFMEDHLNYYKDDMNAYLSDKANIFLHQKKEDFLVLGRNAFSPVRKIYGKKIRSKIISPSHIPATWKLRILGQHNKENISLATAATHVLKIPNGVIKKAVESFKGVPGRMELVKIHKGVKIYNDTTATTPHATIAALRALSKKKNVVLIMGGADKKIDMANLLSEIPLRVKTLTVLPGSGTDRIATSLKKLPVPVEWTKSLKQAVQDSLQRAEKGDIILFSPAFASFGLFKNEFDRGEQFNILVKRL